LRRQIAQIVQPVGPLERLGDEDRKERDRRIEEVGHVADARAHRLRIERARLVRALHIESARHE